MEPERGSSVDLFWIPVGAGTHFQRYSLVLYEELVARWARRRRLGLLHAALKVCVAGDRFTIEAAPASGGPNPSGEVTGPVGSTWAGRLRLFRYQVYVRPGDRLSDQAWAVAPPIPLTHDAGVASRILDLATQVPAYTWGRRRPGHSEMWTSDSTVSWLLLRAGIESGEIGVPAGYRAPGWVSGIEEASPGGP